MAPRSEDDAINQVYPAATTFRPPYPPEYYGWSHPGPGVLVFLKEDPVLRAHAAASEASAVRTLTDSTAHALNTESSLRFERTEAAPALPIGADHSPASSNDGRRVDLDRPLAFSTDRSSAPPASHPQPGAEDMRASAHNAMETWRLAGRFAFPAFWEAFLQTMRSDETAHYYIRRTCGPAIDAPEDPPGPIVDRRGHNPPRLTISNNYANLRVNVVGPDHVQVWVLVPTDAGPAWVEADKGFPHPVREGYALSLKPPEKPQWIQDASYHSQSARSRKK